MIVQTAPFPRNITYNFVKAADVKRPPLQPLQEQEAHATRSRRVNEKPLALPAPTSSSSSSVPIAPRVAPQTKKRMRRVVESDEEEEGESEEEKKEVFVARKRSKKEQSRLDAFTKQQLAAMKRVLTGGAQDPDEETLVSIQQLMEVFGTKHPEVLLEVINHMGLYRQRDLGVLKELAERAELKLAVRRRQMLDESMEALANIQKEVKEGKKTAADVEKMKASLKQLMGDESSDISESRQSSSSQSSSSQSSSAGMAILKEALAESLLHSREQAKQAADKVSLDSVLKIMDKTSEVGRSAAATATGECVCHRSFQ